MGEGIRMKREGTEGRKERKWEGGRRKGGGGG